MEDDRELLKVLLVLLKSRGYSCQGVERGDKAWEIIKKGKIDLVVLDIKLPGMDGLHIARMVKNDPRLKSIPIILITGLTRSSGKTDDYWTVKSGVDDFISKPFDPEKLLEKIEEQLKIYEK